MFFRLLVLYMGRLFRVLVEVLMVFVVIMVFFCEGIRIVFMFI